MTRVYYLYPVFDELFASGFTIAVMFKGQMRTALLGRYGDGPNNRSNIQGRFGVRLRLTLVRIAQGQHGHC